MRETEAEGSGKKKIGQKKRKNVEGREKRRLKKRLKKMMRGRRRRKGNCGPFDEGYTLAKLP